MWTTCKPPCAHTSHCTQQGVGGIPWRCGARAPSAGTCEAMCFNPWRCCACAPSPGTREAVRFLARGVAGQDAALVVVDASCTDSLGERAVADTDQGLLYEHV
eukprot:scaffold140285_cov19-Tisochrysis_lutea.AAC.2